MKQGWEKRELAKACKLFTDGDWIESKDQSIEGIRLIQTGNIGFGEYLDKKEKAKFISEETFKRLKCTEVLTGDILVSRLPEPVGRSCIVPDIKSKMITAVDCTIIRTKENLLPELLRYFQLSNSYLKDVESRTTGTTRNRISRKNLGLIEIPTPPLPEQQRIVTKLDQCFEAVDPAKANIKRNLKNAKELFQSQLNQIFSQKGEGWVEKRFGYVCHFVRGPFGGSLKKSIFVDDGIAVYEQKHAIYDQFEQIRYFITNDKFQEMKRFEIKSGDLIMSCSGTIGKVALVPSNAKKGIINQALLKLSPNKSIVAEYLKYWMESNDFHYQIALHSKGAAIKNVASVKVLKEIQVPLPNIDEQYEVINQLNMFFKKIQSLESHYQQELDALDELKKSILQKAFNGEL